MVGQRSGSLSPASDSAILDLMCTYHESLLRKTMRHGDAIPPELWKELLEAFTVFTETRISPTFILPVITGERKVVPMSWGFRRRLKRKDGKGLTAPKSIVNARDDKMETFTWKDAYHHRRCIVPVTAFYEWTYPGGQMVTHRFHQGEDLMWVAGLWEENPEFGFCHTMVTTEPNREVAATGHDRCLVILQDEEIEPWLDGGMLADFHRQDGILEVESGVPNPRARPKKEEQEQEQEVESPAAKPDPPTAEANSPTPPRAKSPRRRKKDESPPEQGWLF